MVVEEINIRIGNSPEGQWRRDNLMKVPGCLERDKYFEVSFQFVEHTSHGVRQIRLNYKLLK
jgi:hypothetical protein